MKNQYLTTIFISMIIASSFSQAQSWSALGNGITGGNQQVAVLAEYNSELYAAGTFTMAGTVSASAIARWNGTSWSNVGAGTNLFIYAMVVFDGKLYAGGYFNMMGGIQTSGIAKWNGTSWSDVGGGINVGGKVYDLIVYKNDLFAAGIFDSAGTVQTNNIAKWNGTSWSAVGNNGLTGPSIQTSCTDMIEYNGDLYVGGIFQNAGGSIVNNIAKWNGSIWSQAGGGTNKIISTLGVYNNELYASGNFDTAGSIPAYHVAKWDNNSWSSINNGLTGFSSFILYNNNLYAGGTFSGISGYIGMWDGSSWSSVGGGMNSGISGLAIYNGDLYAGGNFTTSGGITTNHVAKLNLPVGISESDLSNNDLKIYPNPASNRFTIEGNSVFKRNIPVTVEIFDITGHCLFNREFKENILKYDIDINEYDSGIYFIKVNQAGKIFYRKIIKE